MVELEYSLLTTSRPPHESSWYDLLFIVWLAALIYPSAILVLVSFSVGVCHDLPSGFETGVCLYEVLALRDRTKIKNELLTTAISDPPMV